MNPLKMLLRQMRREKGYTAVNLGGLAVAGACCLVILLFVQGERQYDRHHTAGDRLVRVVNDRIATDGGRTARAVTPPAFGPTAAANLPEVADYFRLFRFGRTLVRVADQSFFEPNVFLADPSVLDALTLPLAQGDAATALTAPFSVVLSDEMAQKYFGNADPVGQRIILSGDDVYTVTGVFAPQTAPSHVRFDLLGSFSTLERWVSQERLSNWIWQQFYTYLLLEPGTDPAALEAKLPAFLTRHADPETTTRGFRYASYLQPLRDIHLGSAHLTFEFGERGNRTYVVALSFIALFILLIACINYMNLATARSMQRAREVGLRKVVGARRGQLIAQFLGESVALALLAGGWAVALAAAALPLFNAHLGTALTLAPLTTPPWWLGGVGGLLLVGIVAGSYPALYLSAFQPIRVLKGQGQPGAGAARLRQGLVVVQFALSTLLLIGTAVVYQQLRYTQTADLGFEESQLVVLPLRGEMRQARETLKAELLANPLIEAATFHYGTPGDIVAGDDIRRPGDTQETGINHFLIDPDFADTYQLDFAAGRNFDRERPAEIASGFLLNETAVTLLGWASPEEAVGQPLAWAMWGQDSTKTGPVLGVVEDFHFRSLHETVAPVVLHVYPSSFSSLTVRVRPGAVPEALDALRAEWATLAPDWPFEYTFLDEQLAAQYASERRFGWVFGGFALFAIAVACLGLLALAAFMAERRTQELGVRKVLGASVPHLIGLLTKQFLWLVGTGFVIAAPLAYLLMDRWLSTFAYHIALRPGVFLLAGLLVLALACLTVGYQAVRAALVNPVVALRRE